MSSSQFLSKTIVVPTPGGSGVGASGSASELTRPSSAGTSSSAMNKGAKRERRRSRPASASSGLAMADERRKRKGWGALRKVRRFFSRGDGMDDTRVGEVADHAFNYGNVVKYTPGPDSLHAPRHVHSFSEPAPMPTGDLLHSGNQHAGGSSSSTGLRDLAYDNTVQSWTSAEPTRNTLTSEEARHQSRGEARAVHHTNSHTTTSSLSPGRKAMGLSEGKVESPTLDDLGDQPVHLTVKLITKLKDRNEDPTVNAREVVLSKGKNGLGMTLAGSNPVIVMRIDPNGPADRAGILVGDMIVAVTDIDVRRSTQAHVYKMMARAEPNILNKQRAKTVCSNSSKATKKSLEINDAEWDAVKSLQERLDTSEPPYSSTTPSSNVQSNSGTSGGERAAAGKVTTRTCDGPEGLLMDSKARRSRRISLDLTSDNELSDSRSATPDSVKSFNDPPLLVPGNPLVTDSDKNEPLVSLISATSTSTGPPQDSGSELAAKGDGFGVLIRQQSKKVLAKRTSIIASPDSSMLPVALETEEDERIMEMVHNRHSMLLTEAVERCQRDRLDEKTPDGCASDGEEESAVTSSGTTPMSGLSTPDSGDGLDSKSAPNSPSTRRRVKVRRSQSSKGPGVIVKPKTGRVLVAPRPRPTILPGDVAARLVETDHVLSPHVDSGYVSIHQDDLDTEDLEQALMVANIKRGGGTLPLSPAVSPPVNDSSENSLGKAEDSVHVSTTDSQLNTECAPAVKTGLQAKSSPKSNPGEQSSQAKPAHSATEDNVQETKPNQWKTGISTSKGAVRRTKSMVVTGSRDQSRIATADQTTSPSKAIPAWKLELQKQRQAQEEAAAPAQNTPKVPTDDGTSQSPVSRQVKRMNSASVVAAATAKKNSVVAREDLAVSPPSETPSWVALAKDKSRRASMHDAVVVNNETQLAEPNPSPGTHLPIDQTAAVCKNPSPSSPNRASTQHVSRPKSVSSGTLPRLQEVQSAATDASPAKQPGSGRRSFNFGTREMCIVCSKPVYHSERFSAEGLVFHMSCAQCFKCKRKLHLDKLIIVKRQMYCKQHSMEVSMKLAPDIDLGAPMPSMSARGGALAMNN